MIWILLGLTAFAIVLFLFAPWLRAPENARARLFSRIGLLTGVVGIMVIYGRIGRPEFTGENEKALSARLQLISGDFDTSLKSYGTLSELMPDNENLKKEIAQAQQIVGQQQQMDQINNMVEGLAERLYADGGSPEEWARLLRSRWVLGQREQIQKDYNLIKQIFKNEPDVIERIVELAGTPQ